MMRQYVIALGLVLVLGACAPSSLDGLKQEGKKIEFDSKLEYQEAYRLISTQAKLCWRAAHGASEFRVESELLEQEKRGVVKVYGYHPIMPNFYSFWFETVPAKKGSHITLIRQLTFMDVDDSLKKKVNYWLDGGTKCGPEE
jgi:hypothetical protein